MTHEEDPAWLGKKDWEWAQAHLPIACVDLLPVVRDSERRITHVGLVSRNLDGYEVWCHLGGRVRLNESLITAAARHLAETLGTEATSRGELAPKPFTVLEYFSDGTDASRDAGFDPRKHAISNCYLVEYPSIVSTQPGGEAIDFSWFTVDALPPIDQWWPGSSRMVAEALRQQGWNNVELTYQALHSEFTTHNQLMWQTPVLALTAMAFLMTIALG